MFPRVFPALAIWLVGALLASACGHTLLDDGRGDPATGRGAGGNPGAVGTGGAVAPPECVTTDDCIDAGRYGEQYCSVGTCVCLNGCAPPSPSGLACALDSDCEGSTSIVGCIGGTCQCRNPNCDPSPSRSDAG